MKKKTIIIGSLLAVFLMMMIPNVSAVESQSVNNETKSRINEMATKINELDKIGKITSLSDLNTIQQTIDYLLFKYSDSSILFTFILIALLCLFGQASFIIIGTTIQKSFPIVGILLGSIMSGLFAGLFAEISNNLAQQVEDENTQESLGMMQKFICLFMVLPWPVIILSILANR